jgi:hypothetical protein
MSRSNPIDLHEQISERINLEDSRIVLAAREAGIPEHAEKLASWLKDFYWVYFNSRVAEEARGLREIYEHMPVSEEWACDGDGGWPSWDEIFPPQVGQPGHESLLDLYWRLALFWEELPPRLVESKRARGRWAPVFRKDWVETKPSKKIKHSDEIEFREEMTPKNAPAKLFLAVAQLFDRSYSASNCYSVVDRVKNLRRSPETIAKLRERRRRAAARHRAKNRQSSQPPIR